MPPISLAPPSARYLCFAEREEIALARAPGCATLPVGFVEPRRLSRESSSQRGDSVWRIGRRLRSGTATDVPSGRR